MKLLKRLLSRVLVYIGLLGFSALSSFPFWWMLSTALKSRREIMSPTPTFLPQSPTLEHFVYIVRQTEVLLYLYNSVKVGLGVALLATVVSVLGAYALSRFGFRGKGLFMSSVLFTKMFPWLLAMIPLYLIMDRLALVDSHLGLVLIYSVAAIPFCTWMCKGYFDTVPKEMEESALVDGCTRLGVITRVVIPVSLPGLMAVMTYAFLLSLQEFMLALILLSDSGLATLPLGTYRFVGTYGEIEWGPLMASAVLTTLPIVVAFMFIQKYITAGLTSGAVKG